MDQENTKDSTELKEVKSSSEPKKPRKPRAGMSIKHIDLDKVQKRLLNVLSRETNHLLEMSYKGKLDKEDSASLTNYLKLMKDLKKQEEEEANNLSDEELEKLATQKTKDEDNSDQES